MAKSPTYLKDVKRLHALKTQLTRIEETMDQYKLLCPITLTEEKRQHRTVLLDISLEQLEGVNKALEEKLRFLHRLPLTNLWISTTQGKINFLKEWVEGIDTHFKQTAKERQAHLNKEFQQFYKSYQNNLTKLQEIKATQRYGQLTQSAMENNLDQMKQCIVMGALQQDNGDAMLNAVLQNHEPAIALLLTHGASTSKIDFIAPELTVAQREAYHKANIVSQRERAEALSTAQASMLFLEHIRVLGDKTIPSLIAEYALTHPKDAFKLKK